MIDGSPNRISIRDIQEEIEKAKSFKPHLSKLVIATALPKDQKIEEYVRTQSIQNVEIGLLQYKYVFGISLNVNYLSFPMFTIGTLRTRIFIVARAYPFYFQMVKMRCSVFRSFKKRLKDI